MGAKITLKMLIKSHIRTTPEDGSFVFRNMSVLFLYVILYVFLM